MQDDDQLEVDRQYGPWPWIVGFAFGIAIMALMFGLATGSR
ncbi:MAG: hypothetical protein ACK5JT_15820 [Hyphomicrobiaceae bacterium]